MTTTITEALAELKVIDKRVETKRQSITQYVIRQEMVKDPLEKDGGSVTFIERERQSIDDLENRKVAIRRAIQGANVATDLAVNGTTRSIADWLVWRRDVSPRSLAFMKSMVSSINQIRQDQLKKGVNVVASDSAAKQPTDIIVNLNEQQLAKQIEEHEATLGTLDGLLSLKNATTTIEV